MNAELSSKDGRIVMVVAGLSIVVFLFISDGYLPNQGFLSSFFNYMTVLDVHWFCEEAYTPNFTLNYQPAETSCWDIKIQTKYAVLVSLFVAASGYLITQ